MPINPWEWRGVIFQIASTVIYFTHYWRLHLIYYSQNCFASTKIIWYKVVSSRCIVYSSASAVHASFSHWYWMTSPTEFEGLKMLLLNIPAISSQEFVSSSFHHAWDLFHRQTQIKIHFGRSSAELFSTNCALSVIRRTVLTPHNFPPTLQLSPHVFNAINLQSIV